MKIIKLKSVDSTNEYCKRNALGEDLIVIAERQTAGRGTKGRSFYSAAGGLYFSVMRNYENFPAGNAFKIMVNSCVAVCKTLERFGVAPVIRWANDVLVNGKKICGTLIENTFSNGKITRSIVGCGINIYNELPSDLKDIAISIKEASGKKYSVSAVADVLAENIRKEYDIADYKAYINWFGKKVILKTADGEMEAIALDVLEDGRLKVDWCGNILEISSAEVSLRI